MNYSYTVAERFMRYVQIDTQSDPESTSNPSTEKQKNLSRLLAEELATMGLSDVETDPFGYVYATIPASSEKAIPVLCFCSHVDTAPDCSGTNVKPILHANYQGQDIILPDDPSQVISTSGHPYLKERIGDDIITASGLTLLGADDKAGVAIIMDLCHYLIQHPEIKHGKIRILFTPDEEVGRGVEKVDMAKLAADFGYTLDGGERGALESESFSADGVTITIHGISAHPGYAKGKLVNSMKIAGEFLDALPKDSWSPECTEAREGYVHPTMIEGQLEKTTLKFIIRDFETAMLKVHEDRLEKILKEVVARHPGASCEFKAYEQYRNMMDVLSQLPHVTAYAEEAMVRAGVEPQKHIIRGGTDGSRLSFMGLPCPNIFTGEMGIHSRQEYVSVQDMQKAVDTLVELVQIWEEKS
ncbi:MAG TPA: peptidase T [Chitinophagaceae bacterium]|nr:peptidase T [Chitinophagaceae bacterium]HNF71105.1 peptidase T [Chitinophagaceae bacterium]